MSTGPDLDEPALGKSGHTPAYFPGKAAVSKLEFWKFLIARV
jgi:hypothetical protein